MRIGSAKFAPGMIFSLVYLFFFLQNISNGAFNTVRRTCSLLLAFEYVVPYGINFCNCDGGNMGRNLFLVVVYFKVRLQSYVPLFIYSIIR
jgi:hypothetical protein